MNATSMSDISFMLLVFFLVTTSMDVDKGLVMQLPPADDMSRSEVTVVDKDDLMSIVITADNSLIVDGRPVSATSLRNDLESFIARRGSRHIIQIEADPASSYNTYFFLQDNIMAAYSRVRNARARKLFGRDYAQCSDSQRDTVRRLVPQHISEPYKPTEGGRDVYQQTP